MILGSALVILTILGAAAPPESKMSIPFSYSAAVSDAVRIDRRHRYLLENCQSALGSIYKQQRQELFDHWRNYLNVPGVVLLEIVGSTAPQYAYTFVVPHVRLGTGHKYISKVNEQTMSQIAAIRPDSITLSKSPDAADVPCFFLTYVDDSGAAKQCATYWLPPPETSFGKLVRILGAARTTLDPANE